MGESSFEIRPVEKPSEKRLDSWKEIAAYLNRDVTTVQRWEKRENMPVHRHLHDRMGSVYAFPAELDQWAQSRKLQTEQSNTVSSPSAATPTDPVSVSSRTMEFQTGYSLLRWRSSSCWWSARVFGFIGRSTSGGSPVADARFQAITDFDGVEQAAAVSRDGHFVAFLSDRDGQMDVWVAQVGSGEFHNLTRGSAPELVNPSVRTLGFSPDGAFVTFWARSKNSSSSGDIGIWAVPTLGGQPRPYLEGAAEYDWSGDGSRLAYHTPGPGDPLFVSDSRRSERQRIFTAPSGLHSHFPLWAPDGKFIYFIQGSLPDKLDIWRIRPSGGTPERITSQNARLSHPVFLNRRTLLYLASDSDTSALSLYSVDVERRIPHRLTSGPERYTSLAASADGHRLALTLATPKKTFWRLPLADSPAQICSGGSDFDHHEHGVFSTTWAWFFSLRFFNWHEREHLEVRRRKQYRTLARGRSADLRWYKVNGAIGNPSRSCRLPDYQLPRVPDSISGFALPVVAGCPEAAS